MDKHKTFGICNELPYSLKWMEEVMPLDEFNADLINSVYREISEELGMDIALDIYKMFKGTQVTFPVRFFNPKCIKKAIKAEYNGSNAKQLAYDISFTHSTQSSAVQFFGNQASMKL